MSLDEIIAELPKLSQTERRELALRLVEFEADEDIAVNNTIAAQGFARADQEEREAEYREARGSLGC